MRCADLDDLLSAYSDGQTSPAQATLLEAHVLECTRCNPVLARLRHTRCLLESVEDSWTPPDLRLRIAVAMQPSSTTPKRLFVPLRLAVSIVMLLAFAFVGQQVVTHHSLSLASQQAPQISPTCTSCTPKIAAHQDQPAAGPIAIINWDQPEPSLSAGHWSRHDKRVAVTANTVDRASKGGESPRTAASREYDGGVFGALIPVPN